MKAQLIYLMLVLIGLGFCIAKHGQPRSPYNVWADLIATIIVLSILYWGGFFDVLIKSIW